MAAVKDSIVDLERYRLQLEDSVAKLRKSLQYWQTWEADYEGMKEEILGLEEVHTEAELVPDCFEELGPYITLTLVIGASWTRLRRHCTER